MAAERPSERPQQRDLLSEIAGGRLFTPEVHTGASNDRYKLSQRLWPSDDTSPTETWAAIDFTLRRPVTVRLVDVNTEAGQRMRLQTQSLARLEHPGLLHILDTYSPGRRLAVVTEQVPSHTLADEIRPAGDPPPVVTPMAPAEALLVGASVAEALAALHECGFAHGGVTAADVGRRPEGGYVILTGPPTSDAVQIPATPTNDVRSVGALVHELIVGAPPHVRFDGTWEISDQVPPAVVPLIDRAQSASNPWPDARAAQRACHEARSQLNNQIAAPVRRRAKHRWLITAIGIVAAAALLAAASLVASRLDSPSPDVAPLTSATANPLPVSTADGDAPTLDALSPDAPSPDPPSLGTPSASAPTGSAAADRTPVAAPSYPAALVPLEIAHITDFDPAPGGDRVEHPERLRLINNGDPTQGWHTEQYRTADFGGLKNGVGLIVGLGEPQQLNSDGTSAVAQFTVHSPDVGWRFELYASTDRYHALIDWGDPIAVVAATSSPTTLLTNNVKASSLLVWITSLGPEQDDGDFSVTITDVAVERELPS